MKKQLYPPQQQALEFFLAAHRSGRNTLDSSMVGTGKTVVGCHLAAALGRPVGIVCPKSVLASWRRECDNMQIRTLFVLNFEKLRTGRTPWLTKTGKKAMRWQLPADTLLIFDEVHKCKGAFTQNAQLLIAARNQNIGLHMLSATACQDPTEMRALGYALNLHALNSPANGLYSWQGWMRKHGCSQDPWGGWYLRNKASLHDLHTLLYGPQGQAKRLAVEDFPDSFRANRVHLLPVQCAGSVDNVFSKAGLGAQDLYDYIVDEQTPADQQADDDEPFIVRLLRARQEAELLKAPEVAALAADYLDDEMAVVCFVNFRETAHALADELKCGIIEGGQTADQRQQLVDAFQKGQIHKLVVNVEAGGTGLSLHHENPAARPRVSLISPTYNAKTHLQVLGRTHRNGALSDALQFVVLAADSVEEQVAEAIDRKCEMLALLHGINYQPLNPTTE